MIQLIERWMDRVLANLFGDDWALTGLATADGVAGTDHGA